MPKLTVYNMQGAKVAEQELPATVFAAPVKTAVLHEAVVAHEANARRAIAHTKTRGEVRGGGKKPWRQKGTGRARHGSSRSPIWVGGGITFGPRNTRNFSLKINRKTKQAAVRMALSEKVAHEKLVLLDHITAAAYKTKVMDQMFRALPITRRSVLVALPGRHAQVVKSMANLPYVTSVNVGSLNILDLLSHDVVITTTAGAEKMAELFA